MSQVYASKSHRDSWPILMLHTKGVSTCSLLSLVGYPALCRYMRYAGGRQFTSRPPQRDLLSETPVAVYCRVGRARPDSAPGQSLSESNAAYPHGASAPVRA